MGRSSESWGVELRARRGGALRGGGGTGTLGEGPVGAGLRLGPLGAVLHGAALERSSLAGAGLCVRGALGTRGAGRGGTWAGAGPWQEAGSSRGPSSETWRALKVYPRFPSLLVLRSVSASALG